MHKTTAALFWKLAMTFGSGLATLGLLERNPTGWVLLSAIIIAAVNYLVGDLMLFPSFGNLIAAIGEGFLAVAVAYVVALFTPPLQTSAISLAIFGALIAMGEGILHGSLLGTPRAAL